MMVSLVMVIAEFLRFLWNKNSISYRQDFCNGEFYVFCFLQKRSLSLRKRAAPLSSQPRDLLPAPQHLRKGGKEKKGARWAPFFPG